MPLSRVRHWLPHLPCRDPDSPPPRLPLAAKASIPNVITFSGNRNGMSDEEGARNTIAGLNRVKKIAEDNGVVICLELLNSKVDHKDYMCDRPAWGLNVVRVVGFHTGTVTSWIRSGWSST